MRAVQNRRSKVVASEGSEFTCKKKEARRLTLHGKTCYTESRIDTLVQNTHSQKSANDDSAGMNDNTEVNTPLVDCDLSISFVFCNTMFCLVIAMVNKHERRSGSWLLGATRLMVHAFKVTDGASGKTSNANCVKLRQMVQIFASVCQMNQMGVKSIKSCQAAQIFDTA